MSKRLKKTLIFLAMLAVIIIVVILLQLFVLDNVDTETVTTPSPSVSETTTPTPSPSPSDSPSPSPSPTAWTVTTEETTVGTMYALVIPGAYGTVSLTLTDDTFTYSEVNEQAVFQAFGYENESLKFVFVEDAKATMLVPSFLDDFIYSMEFEQSGESFINGTEIVGETVSANDGTIQIDAWLVDTENGVVAVIISYALADKDTQFAELNALLGTLSIEPPIMSGS